MYKIDLVMEAISLYENNKSYGKTSKILQTKYELEITRSWQTVSNWYKWIKTDVNKICKKINIDIILFNNLLNQILKLNKSIVN